MTRTGRARAVAAVLAAAGLACVTLGVRADPAPASVVPGATAPALSTPLVSPRRVPSLFVDAAAAVAAARTQRQLAATVSPFDACVAVDDADGAAARIAASRPLAGASTQKLLVAAAALAALGPAHRFTTTASATVAVHAGDLAGNLVIVGSGDPVLTTATVPDPAETRLSDLADAIVRAGVRRIDGALLANDTAFDRERAVADWKPSEIAEGDVGALGALIVDGGRGDNGLPAADPALTTVQKLAAMLTARGVQIAGGARHDLRPMPPATHEIAQVESPPLTAIVEEMLTVSNDETAEQLTKALGRTRNPFGTTAGGIEVVLATLKRTGVPVAGVDLHDGSGLAPTDRVTCDALLRTVELRAQPRFAAIDRGLPVAGRTGTLAGRFAGTSLAGRLRAKTGHIDGVVGLAGVIDGASSPPGTTRTFAFVANGGFTTLGGDHLQDEIAAAVAAYRAAPDAAELVPAP